MWCSTCSQDVPGVANATTGRLVCSRCQQPTTARRPEAPIRDEGIALDEPVVAAAINSAPPIRSDDWVTRQRTRELSRTLRQPMHFHPSATSNATNALHSARRLTPPHDLAGAVEGITPPQIAAATSSVTAREFTKRRRTSASQFVAWLVVAGGFCILSAGVSIIGWSLYLQQMQYWNLGIGLSLGGQGALILGLVLVVSRLWRNSRYAVNRLHEVHTRLTQLQHTADALTATRNGGAPAFYAELARGASPQMLLSNLKGQLDQLAAKLGSR